MYHIFSKMKIVLYSGARSSYSGEELTSLLNELDRMGFTYLVNTEFAEIIERIAGRSIPSEQQYTNAGQIPEDARMMICYGGDGTFLGGVRLLENRPLPMVGVNSGRLGFLATISKENLAQALGDIRNGNYRTEQRTLIETEGSFLAGEHFPFAFNEFSVQRQAGSMISVEVYVDSEMIATYWGDGVLVSTPTGSTAYSLSVGGPVVAPDCRCFVISPLSPHNLTMRPVVIPDTATITMKVDSRMNDFIATLDSRNYPARDKDIFYIKKAKNPIFLVQFQNISFYDTLRNKMMWGMDRRDPARQ